MQGRSSYPRPDKTLPLKIVSLKTSPSDNNNFLRCSRSAGSTSTYSASTATAAAAPGATATAAAAPGATAKGVAAGGATATAAAAPGATAKGVAAGGATATAAAAPGATAKGVAAGGATAKGVAAGGATAKGVAAGGGGQWYEPRAKMEHVLLLTKGCLTVQFEGDAFAFFRCPRLKPIYPRRTTFTYKFHTS